MVIVALWQTEMREAATAKVPLPTMDSHINITMSADVDDDISCLQVMLATLQSLLERYAGTVLCKQR